MNARNHYLSLLKASAAREFYTNPTQEAIRKGISEWIVLHGYRDTEDSLDCLSCAIGIPRDEISSFIKEFIGQRFMTMRKELRIEDAKEFLIFDRKISPMMVSAMVGISDRSDFRKEFTREVGCSPRIWKKYRGNKMLCGISQILEIGRNRCL